MLPCAFTNHGGGPLPLLGDKAHTQLLREWAPDSRMHTLVHDPRVTTIVVISAHHESAHEECLIQATPRPKLLFDYSGFPQETYEYTMPNPGNPALAERIQALLAHAQIPCTLEQDRGFDHGVFVPLLVLEVARKRPTLPIIQVSLRGPCEYAKRTTNRQEEDVLTTNHWKLGQALRPLRSEGILLLGSGSTFHNMGAFFAPEGSVAQKQAVDASRAFDQFLRTAGGAKVEVIGNIRKWAQHEQARYCHPRPEHILPLIVIAGAAEDVNAKGKAEAAMCEIFSGITLSNFIFE